MISLKHNRQIYTAKLSVPSCKMLQNLKKYFEEFGESPQCRLEYGTAGFRGDASILNPLFYRIGVFAVIKSYITRNSNIGICITASHNVVTDNGVKICDYDGGLVDLVYEQMIIEFVNTTNPFGWVLETCKKLSINLENPKIFHKCKVIIGYDTRPSSMNFAQMVSNCINVLEAECIQLGAVTTPQLQFAVDQSNLPELATVLKSNHILHYFSYFENSIRNFVKYLKGSTNDQMKHSVTYLDCANGVGATQIKLIEELMSDLIGLSVILRNTGDKEGDILNFNCGSDYIQRKKLLPDQFYNDKPNQKCCAFDGDVDRIVYFTFDENHKLFLMDGDRIAVLFLHILCDLLSCIQAKNKMNNSSSLSIGYIQTAYANGAVSKYIEKTIRPIIEQIGHIDFNIQCVNSGIKYLHAAALKYDIGIYFESNGHGTILHKPKKLADWTYPCSHKDQLYYFLNLFNKSTGDAMMNFVAVELSLQLLKWSHQDWLNLYTDKEFILDSVQASRENLNKLVPHKEHSKWLIEPVALQDEINNILTVYDGARLFVRPSGTENICRIYVEANSHAECEQILNAAKSILSNYLGLDTYL